MAANKSDSKLFSFYISVGPMATNNGPSVNCVICIMASVFWLFRVLEVV